MSKIIPKAKEELDKLIKIARTYRDDTITLSLFMDIVYSLPNTDEDIFLYKEYFRNEKITLLNSEDEIEDILDTNDFSNIKPYDTSNIDISPKPLSLDMLIARLENDEIDLMPDFQRKSGLWGQDKKSQLIESLILRIPLPAFYFDGSNSDNWIVIDGLQRLTALKEFFVDKEKLRVDGLNQLKLSGLEFLKDLEGANVEDMPRSYLRRMKETQIITYIINPGAPVNLKYNIFKRINTGGLELEPQEIRHALFQGFATDFLKELATMEEFKIATGYSVKTDRMLDREFVLRFISFYELDEDTYKDSIDSFLNRGMDYINKNYNETYAQNVKKIFFNVLKTCSEIFGKYAFRRMPDTEKRRPISKALFETWVTILARYSCDEYIILIQKKEEIINKYISMCSDNKEFIHAIGSGKPQSVKKRFELLHKFIEEFL